jgi:hypothetical protein
VPASTPRRWRGIAAWVLAVLTAIAVTASVVGLWVHRVAFDTDAFMATVTPVVESESVQAVVSDRVASDLVEALDLEARISGVVTQAEERFVARLGEALGVSAEVLERLIDTRLGLEQIAPALAAGAEARIEDAVHRFVSSPDGTQMLLSLVEVAHERTVHLLRDEVDQLPNLVVADGEVRFNTVPLLAAALRAAVNQGLDVIGIDRQIPPFDSAEDADQAVARLADVLGRDLPDDFGQVTVGSQEGLQRAQDLARLFDRIVWLVLVVTLVLAVAAALVAPSIRQGVMRVGVAAVVGALAGWLIVEAITAGLPDAAATADGQAAIADLTGALVTSLRTIALLLAAVGALAAVLAFLPTVMPARLEGESAVSPDRAPPSAPATGPIPPTPTFADESTPPPAEGTPPPAESTPPPADGAPPAAVAEPPSAETETAASDAESPVHDAESASVDADAPAAGTQPPVADDSGTRPRRQSARRRKPVPPPDA